MLAFAMPLLQLLGRLRRLTHETDPSALRDRTETEIHAFIKRATEAGFPADQVRRAGYALADSLDDAVLNTPWGARSVWATAGMVTSLYPTIPPGRFLDALRQAQANPGPVLEILLLCMSFGMLGSLRSDPAGAEQLRQAATAAMIRHGPAAPGTVATAWHGIDAPYRRRRGRLPLWVVATAAVAAAAGLYLWLETRTDAAGDALFTAFLDAPPAALPALTREPVAPPPPAPPPPEPTTQDRLRAALPTLTVAGSPANPILRLPEAMLFPPGSATLLPGAVPLLQSVADALKPEPGRLGVVAYSDDRPFHSVAFPSAFKLTAARANAVRTVLERTLGSAAGITAEGRAAAEPIAPNATAPGREANRRVELTLDPANPRP